MLSTTGMLLMRIWCVAAIALFLVPLDLPEATAQDIRYESSRSNRISISRTSAIPLLRAGNDTSLELISLAFSVSVCLADVEYSIACWERSLAEAAKRLEQIYVDDYMTRRAAGSLKIWFPLATEQSEQLRFLREAEERAIKAVAARLQTEGDQSITSEMNSPKEYEEQNPIRRRIQQVQKWREDATIEARKGSNWSHNWSSKTHSYQVGLALQELMHIANQRGVGN